MGGNPNVYKECNVLRNNEEDIGIMTFEENVGIMIFEENVGTMRCRDNAIS